jgi:hypothetical protein
VQRKADTFFFFCGGQLGRQHRDGTDPCFFFNLKVPVQWCRGREKKRNKQKADGKGSGKREVGVSLSSTCGSQTTSSCWVLPCERQQCSTNVRFLRLQRCSLRKQQQQKKHFCTFNIAQQVSSFFFLSSPLSLTVMCTRPSLCAFTNDRDYHSKKKKKHIITALFCQVELRTARRLFLLTYFSRNYASLSLLSFVAFDFFMLLKTHFFLFGSFLS